jgi:hypothetical protein
LQLLVAATDLNVSLTAELKSQNTTDGGVTLGAKNLSFRDASSKVCRPAPLRVGAGTPRAQR